MIQDINCPTCNIKLLDHSATQCLNEWVAFEVMQWRACHAMPLWIWIDADGEQMADQNFNPSGSIADAWKVLVEIGKHMNVLSEIASQYGDWGQDQGESFMWRLEEWIQSDYAPRSICRAAVLVTRSMK